MKQLYLNHRLVMPGDVLVSLGRGIMPKGVSKATKGDYWHAAICLAPTLLYEADRKGVYSTPLEFACFKDQAGDPRFGLHLPHLKKAKLLRHPLIEARLAKEYYDVQDDFAYIAAEYFTRPYSELGRLLCALPPSNPFQPVGQKYEKRLLKNSLGKKDRRIFCTELVAAIYEELAVPLFKDNRPAVTVNAVALADDSELKEVVGAVLPGKFRRCSDEEAAKVESSRNVADPRKSQIKRARDLKGEQQQSERVIEGMRKSPKR
jgi:hypothetical protein